MSKNKKKVNIGLIGCGRVGRAITRIAHTNDSIDIKLIDDINPDIENIAYLIKYDSTYGTFESSVEVIDSHTIKIDDKEIKIYNEDLISKIPWDKHDIDIIIDSSGAFNNVKYAKKCLEMGVKKVIFTHSPKQVIPSTTRNKLVDHTIVLGVSENDYEPSTHHLLSSSICDATALSPVLKLVNQNVGIEQGFVTTLHPWLSYQNLSDAQSHSWSHPGKVYKHYPLGRASLPSIIPKPTTAIDATYELLPELIDKITCFSYRIPTAIVASSDISLILKNESTTDEIKKMFYEYEKTQKWKVIHNSDEPLVSIDYKGTCFGSIIDHRWTEVTNNNRLKLVLWYDNEWGYSSQVVDIIKYIISKEL